MVSSTVSSRSREGFRRPSDREDIVYPDRGQLGLPSTLYAGKSPAATKSITVAGETPSTLHTSLMFISSSMWIISLLYICNCLRTVQVHLLQSLSLSLSQVSVEFVRVNH